MRRVRILEEASDEAIAAAAWYDQEKPGLGAEFEQALDAALDLLEEDLAPSVPVPGVTGTRGAKRLLLRGAIGDIPHFRMSVRRALAAGLASSAPLRQPRCAA